MGTKDKKIYIEEFALYLRNEKRLADNSLNAYKTDVMEFMEFEEGRGTDSPEEVTSTEIIAYLNSLKVMGKSPSTVNRKLASARAFFNFLISERRISANPTAGIKTPKIEKKELSVLSIEDIEKLLECPDESPKGKRDRAILEVMYATGIKVSELIEADLEDINLRMGFITCYGEHSRTRIVPLGKPSVRALETYLNEGRNFMVKNNREERALFVNYLGKRITRQGLWKILKEYGEAARLEQKLTPNTLRNSFAVHMLQNGADLKTLQELMGHEDISATQMYLAATKNRIKDVYDKSHPRAK